MLRPEQEDLDGKVRVDVVGTHHGNHVPPEVPFDDRAVEVVHVRMESASLREQRLGPQARASTSSKGVYGS